MRVQTLTNGVKVYYPDNRIWTRDNNYVVFKANNFSGFTAHLRVTGNGQMFFHNYTTETDTIIISINDECRIIGSTSALWMTASAIVGATTDSADIQDIELYRGKSLINRHHGSEGVITYHPSDRPAAIDVYFPFDGGHVICGGVQTTMQSRGVKTIALNAATNNIVMRDDRLTPSPKFIGNVWGEAEVTEHVVELREVCPSSRPIRIDYTNTDGCKRSIFGDVLKWTERATADDYRDNKTIYNREPNRIVTGYTCEAVVGFRDVEPSQYISDVLQASDCKLWRGGEAIGCTPVTMQLESDGKVGDVKITFKIDA